MAHAMGRHKGKIQCRWGLTGPLPWFFHVSNGLVGRWSELPPFNKVQSVVGGGEGRRGAASASSHPQQHPPGRSTWGLKSGGILFPPRLPALAFFKAVIQKDPSVALLSKPGVR